MCDNPHSVNCTRLRALLRSVPFHSLELTQPELLDISRWINREFAPRFNSPMVKHSQPLGLAAQELLSISSEISREYSPLSREAAANLVLLPIDKQHVYAYWRLHADKTGMQSTLKPAEDLTLRIFTPTAVPAAAVESTAPPLPDWYDFRIHAGKSCQAVALPEAAAFSSAVSAAIGVARSEQEFLPLLLSNQIDMPMSGSACATADPHIAALTAAMAQFISTGTPASSPAGNPLC
jgi:hypothetical protein